MPPPPPALSAPSSSADSGRPLGVNNVNCAMAWSPFPVVVMRPFVPSNTLQRGRPFVAKSMWKAAVNGIKALKRLKLNVGDKQRMKADLIVVTAHTHGHLMIWNAEDYSVMNAVTHFNSVTINDFVVTNSRIYTLVEKDAKLGKSGDDVDVYVWDLNTFELITQLSGHEDRVSAIAVESDESRIITGSVDKSILIWDLKKLPHPVARLMGHQMMITKLILSGRFLISGSSDATVRVWNLDTNTCLHALEGHQGSIAVLTWVVFPFSDIAHGSVPNDVAYFISACAGGLVRFTSLKPVTGEVLSLWTNKAHKALVTDVCWDGDIVVSSSAADGLNFYNMASKSSVRLSFGDSGVRQVAIDTQRRLVVAATDAGMIVLINYEMLMTPGPDSETLHIVATLQPHMGSITSIILERAANNQWERIITSSNDHTLFTLDFDTTRGARTFAGSGSRNFVHIPQTSTCVSTNENNAVTWDPVDMVLKTGRGKNLEGHSRRITALRYSAEFQKIITGGDDGFVRTWDVLLYENDNAELAREEVIESADVLDLTQPVRTMSSVEHHLIAVGTQKANAKAGSIAVLNIDRGSAAVASTVTAFVYPTYVKLLTHEVAATAANAPPVLHITVLAQLRNGEVLLCCGVDGGAFAAHRSIIKEQIPYLPEREMDGSLPVALKLRAQLNKNFYTPRVEVLAADGERNVRCFDASTDPADVSANVSFNVGFDANVNDFRQVGQSDIAVAVACENGSTYMVGAKGAILLEVRYDGSVYDPVAEAVRPTRRSRSFLKVSADGSGPATPLIRKASGASCLAVSRNARVLVIGYRDGVLCLYDLAQKFVCRRIHAHTSGVLRCWILPEELRLVSSSVAGTLRFDTIFLRNVREGTSVREVHDRSADSSHPRYVDDGKERDAVEEPQETVSSQEAVASAAAVANAGKRLSAVRLSGW